MRLIRSKGVGVYFVTQSPKDIPAAVLGQLGQRVQHALRAFTPRDQKAVKSAATTMRPNPKLDIEAAITELGVGEALVSLLDEKGRPGVTERAFVIAPGSRLGPVTPEQRQALIRESLVYGHYEKTEDRESAYEKLKDSASPAAAPAPAKGGPVGAPSAAEPGGGLLGALGDMLLGKTGPPGGHHPGVLDAVVKSAARSVGSSIGREITRGVLGSILGGGKPPSLKTHRGGANTQRNS